MSIYTGDNWGEPPVGSILQYTQNNTNTNWTYSTTQDWFELLSNSITPKFSSSRILILVSACGGFGGGQNACMKITRNGSDIATGVNGGRNCAISVNAGPDFSAQHRLSNCNYTWIDAPGTTSAVTYRIYFSTRSDEGNKGFRFNEPYDSNANGYNYHGMTGIQLLEIAQ